MDWPSLSPDLNPIENVWGEMARQVYANGRQFDNIDQLKSKIIQVWDDLSLEYLQKLVNSIVVTSRWVTLAGNSLEGLLLLPAIPVNTGTDQWDLWQVSI